MSGFGYPPEYGRARPASRPRLQHMGHVQQQPQIAERLPFPAGAPQAQPGWQLRQAPAEGLAMPHPLGATDGPRLGAPRTRSGAARDGSCLYKPGQRLEGPIAALLNAQMQALIAKCLGQAYQASGKWVGLDSEREIVELLKSSFLQRLELVYRETCKCHHYSLDLTKKALLSKKSAIGADQDLRPLTEYFWHKGRMERIMKNYKYIAKVTIEQKDAEKEGKGQESRDSQLLEGQVRSSSVSRVSPNLMQAIEYAEVAYNQRILLAKVGLHNVRAALCSEGCERMLPGPFRHSQLRIIESMLSKS